MSALGFHISIGCKIAIKHSFSFVSIILIDLNYFDSYFWPFHLLLAIPQHVPDAQMAYDSRLACVRQWKLHAYPNCCQAEERQAKLITEFKSTDHLILFSRIHDRNTKKSFPLHSLFIIREIILCVLIHKVQDRLIQRTGSNKKEKHEIRAKH